MADLGTPVPLARAKVRKIAASLPDHTREELAAALVGMTLVADNITRTVGQGRFMYHAGYARALSEVADLFGAVE